MNIPPYCSKYTFYRTPSGAVTEGTKIHFKIILPKNLGCSEALLNIKHDSQWDWNYCTMFWCGSYDHIHDVWECHYTVDKIGLYWHGFKLHTREGERFIVPAGPDIKSEIVRSPGASWQITCYKKDFKTPDWPKGGIMYQIFPDRFNYSGQRKENIPSDRTIRENWGEMPEWRPNHHGEITNSDFFMGDLKGITQKLDYLESLGVTCLYLNPIFNAYSNHRYDTGDYSKIDVLMGTQEDFEELCKEAKARNMHVINDGVYSHTGSDSIYFNRKSRYDSVGAYNSKESPYFSWYHFSEWPNHYNSWWGFYTLPEVNETDPQFNEYINGENGIVRKWIKSGSSGWRLDVADELPDQFLVNLRKAVKAEDENAIVIGEVWEDASLKEGFGGRRHFLTGNQLDSVMNYPFRSAILDFLKGADAKDMMERILCVVENYPKPVVDVLMNLLSTHDTERAITLIAGEPLYDRDRNWQAHNHLTPQQKQRGIALMKIASAILYTLPGFPCIYYGDEVGMEGYKDPFNRGCFPWGNENQELLSWYRRLGEMRKHCPALVDGDIINSYSQGRQMSFVRHNENSALFCSFNAGFHDLAIDIPPGYRNAKPLLDTIIRDGKVIIPANSCAFLQI